jgi:excisionase family DNA binding protein
VSEYGSARPAPITFPRKPGRPARSGHATGHAAPRTRMNTGPARRTVAVEAPAIAPDQRLLSVDQAARYLALSPWTVRDMLADGRLQRVNVAGCRRVLLDRAALDAMIVAVRAS